MDLSPKFNCKIVFFLKIVENDESYHSRNMSKKSKTEMKFPKLNNGSMKHNLEEVLKSKMYKDDKLNLNLF